jgi:hypothetical protein
MEEDMENKWLIDSGCWRHMTWNKKWFSNLTTLSHKEYVTFGDDKKGKVFGTGIIKVNDYFTLNDVALVDKLRYNLFLSLSWSMLIWMFSFTSLVHKFLILLANLFVVFLALAKSFKLISHLFNLLWRVWSLSLRLSTGSGIGD